MFYFEKREMARSFARKADGYRLVDNGTAAPAGRRWGVQCFKRSK